MIEVVLFSRWWPRLFLIVVGNVFIKIVLLTILAKLLRSRWSFWISRGNFFKIKVHFSWSRLNFSRFRSHFLTFYSITQNFSRIKLTIALYRSWWIFWSRWEIFTFAEAFTFYLDFVELSTKISKNQPLFIKNQPHSLYIKLYNKTYIHKHLYKRLESKGGWEGCVLLYTRSGWDWWGGVGEHFLYWSD